MELELDWGEKETDHPDRPRHGAGDESGRGTSLEEDEEQETLDRTGFLLQRLQELKQWQKEQEMKLFLEQKEEMERLKADKINQEENESVDDDATIDQDVSSLTSYEETPRNGRFDEIGSDSTDSPEEEELLPANKLRENGDHPIPSWASRVTNSENSQDPKTVLTRKSVLNSMKISAANNSEIESESRPVPNIDDKVIVPSKKSFQELLAEQLGLGVEEIEKEEPAFVKRSEPPRTNDNRAKTFLRKGSGLSRYGGVGSPPKAFRRSKSQNNVSSSKKTGMKPSNSCEKFDLVNRETIASQKSPSGSTGAKSKANQRVMSKSTTSLPMRNSNNSTPKLKSNSKLTKNKSMTQSVPGLKLRPKMTYAHDDRQSPIHDSVELSFREKLKKADKSHKKELEDLVAFEKLEEAACDSSFCSSSSKVKTLMKDFKMPSPILKPSKSLTSTPKINAKVSYLDQVTDQFQNNGKENDNLMLDIQKFLEKRGAIVTDDVNSQTPNISFSEDDDDEGDTSNTLKEEMSDKRADPVTADEENNRKDTESDGENEGWCSLDENDTDEEEFEKRNEFYPQAKTEKNRSSKKYRQEMDFSPPRIPRNTPSYLIWSIFTKEREEKRKKLQKVKNQNGRKPQKGRGHSPLSQVPLTSLMPEEDAAGVSEFQGVILNAKLTELESEIEKFKKESTANAQLKRKLVADRKKLAEEVANFEKAKESEKKKNEEEKRRIRRDRMMLEKEKKDKRNLFDDKKPEVEELQNKLDKMEEDSQRKETKWNASLSRLQEQVKYLERENQILHEENHKLKLKGVSSKVSSHLVDKRERKNEPQKAQVIALGIENSIEKVAKESRHPEKVSSNPLLNEITTPRLNFSPAESLDSDVTLVSGAVDSIQTKPEDFPHKNNSNVPKLKNVIKKDSKGMVEKHFDDGSLEISYSNGNKKLISPCGSMIKVFYYNGDVKETLPSGLIKYFYKQSNTWHLTYPDKKEVLQFSNGQEEIRYPDGSLQISFSDGSLKKIAVDGSEEMTFPDGTKVEVNTEGERTLYLTNGQKEIHSSEFKRREYPDGSVKTLYNDGRQETRYSNGRVRIKNKEGSLLHDSHAEDKEDDSLEIGTEKK